MGLFDRLTFEDGIDVDFPDIGTDPFEVTWQTKSIPRHQPMMENYKVTAAGHLFKQEYEYEHVPEEERPHYNEGIGWFESPMREIAGSMRKVHQGWSDAEYHGTFELHKTVNGDYVSLEAKFTDGQLVEITRND